MSEPSNSASGQFVNAVAEGEILILTISSREIRDTEISYALRDEMTAQVDAFDSRHAVIDLQAVDYIGSVGLLALLGVRRRLRDAGGRIVICNMGDLIREMLDACRLISPDPARPAVFETAATRDEALAMLRA